MVPPAECHHTPGRFGKLSGLPRPWQRHHQTPSGSISRHALSIHLSGDMLSPCQTCAPLERHTRRPSGARESLEGWQALGGEASCLLGLSELGLRVRARFGESPGFTPSLKCFSSHSDNCLDVGNGPLLQFPHPLRTGPVLLTLLFFPLIHFSY